MCLPTVSRDIFCKHHYYFVICKIVKIVYFSNSRLVNLRFCLHTHTVDIYSPTFNRKTQFNVNFVWHCIKGPNKLKYNKSPSIDEIRYSPNKKTEKTAFNKITMSRNYWEAKQQHGSTCLTKDVDYEIMRNSWIHIISCKEHNIQSSCIKL